MSPTFRNTIDCTFPRAEMAAALGRLASVLPTRTTLPVLSNVRISPSDDGESLRLEATDMDRRAEAAVPLSEACESFAPVCLPLALLLSMMVKYPGVQARLLAKGDMVTLSSGASRGAIPALPGGEFPELWMGEGDDFRAVGGGDGAALKLALSRVTHAKSEELARALLCGVHLASNGSGMVAVACDGPQLSREGAFGWETEMEPVTIANAGVDALLKFFPGEGPLKLEASQQRLRFSNPDASLIVPTLDIPYPNYEQVIPKDGDIFVTVERVALIAALQRISLVFASNGDDLTRTVFDFSGDGISLHAASEAGEADEAVPAEVVGGPLRIGLGARLVLNALNSLPGETVTVELKAPERATIWRCEGEDGLRLVMPLRLL